MCGRERTVATLKLSFVDSLALEGVGEGEEVAWGRTKRGKREEKGEEGGGWVSVCVRKREGGR